MTLDFPKAVSWMHRSGKIGLNYGPREGGKTHTDMVLEEYTVTTDPNAFLLTNTPFRQLAGLSDSGAPIWKAGYPERVFPVESVEDVFRLTAEILSRRPRALIGVDLDEMQNYALSETGQDPMNVLLNRWAGVPRKFMQFLKGRTPVFANFPKRWRHLSDDPSYGGNCSFLISKDLDRVRQWNHFYGTDYDIKELAFIQISYVDPKRWEVDPFEGLEAVEVPVSKWTRPWETPEDLSKLKVGDIVYDHLGSGDLDIGGPGFDFQEMLKVVSGKNKISDDAPRLLLQYFESVDAFREELASAEERKNSIPAIVRRMREEGHEWEVPTWKQIEYWFMTPASTLRGQVDQMERDERWASS